jgi:hypothetical protein
MARGKRKHDEVEDETVSTKHNLKTIIENQGTPYKKGKYDSKFIVPHYSEEKGRLGKIELPYFIKPLYQGNMGVEDFAKELNMVQGTTLAHYPNERLTRIQTKLREKEINLERSIAANSGSITNNVSGGIEDLMRTHDTLLQLYKNPANATAYPEILKEVVKYWEYLQLRISHYVYDKVLNQLRESAQYELVQPIPIADTTKEDLDEEELKLKLALIQNKKKKSGHKTETKNQKRLETALSLGQTQSVLPPIASTLVSPPPSRSSVVIEEIGDFEPRVTRSQVNGSTMMVIEDGDL